MNYLYCRSMSSNKVSAMRNEQMHSISLQLCWDKDYLPRLTGVEHFAMRCLANNFRIKPTRVSNYALIDCCLIFLLLSRLQHRHSSSNEFAFIGVSPPVKAMCWNISIARNNSSVFTCSRHASSHARTLFLPLSFTHTHISVQTYAGKGVRWRQRGGKVPALRYY